MKPDGHGRIGLALKSNACVAYSSCEKKIYVCVLLSTCGAVSFINIRITVLNRSERQETSHSRQGFENCSIFLFEPHASPLNRVAKPPLCEIAIN